jgi:hypothetical protein
MRSETAFGGYVSTNPSSSTSHASSVGSTITSFVADGTKLVDVCLYTRLVLPAIWRAFKELVNISQVKNFDV